MWQTRNLLLLLLFVLIIIWYRHVWIDDWLLGIQFPISTQGSILISGASSGIGRAACGALAERHPTLDFVCGIRNVNAAVGYPFHLSNVRWVQLDVTDADQIKNVIEGIQTSLVGIVCNAGIADLSTLEFQSLDRLQQIYDVNVFGTLRLTQAALPALRKNKGRIVWVTSMSSLVPGMIRWGGYQSSKVALDKLGEALRKEIHDFGVSLSMVLPGFLSTVLTNRVSRKNAAIQSKTSSEENEADKAIISKEEYDTYPHLYQTDYLKYEATIFNHGGSMDETTQAIDDSLFSLHPRTKYYTSILTVFPSWLVHRMNGGLSFLSTDRFTDTILRELQALSAISYTIQIQKKIWNHGWIAFLRSWLVNEEEEKREL